MKPKVTEIDKLKYWVDSEFSVMHGMFAIIMLQLTHGTLPTIIFSVYLFISAIYSIVRVLYVGSLDKEYLRVPKK